MASGPPGLTLAAYRLQLTMGCPAPMYMDFLILYMLYISFKFHIAKVYRNFELKKTFTNFNAYFNI